MTDDLLDILITALDADTVKTATALVKLTKGGYRTVPQDDLDAEYGELQQIDTRQITVADEPKEIPVYEQKVSEDDKSAQEARSKKYGISIKDGGSVTMPKRWKDAGLSETDFADPVNFAYPMHDESHARNALARWSSNKDKYTSEEQGVIEKRMKSLAKKQGVDTDSLNGGKGGPGGAAEIKATELVIEDDRFVQEEVKDRLGRSTYVFTHGEVGDDALEHGFVYRGGVAKLRMASDTSDEEARRLLSALTMHKSAKSGARQKATNDFLDGLEDVMESLGCSAISSVIYSFQSAVMDAWDGELEDLDDATFGTFVDGLAKALRTIWGTFSNYDAEMAQLGVDLRNVKRAYAGVPVGKAGRALSRARREALENAQAIIESVLDEEKDDKKLASELANKSATVTGNGDLIDKGVLSVLQSELARVKDARTSELDQANERLQQQEQALRQAKALIAEKDALLETLGKEPAADPRRVTEPQPSNDGKGAKEKSLVPVTGTVYDLIPSDYGA